MNNILIIPRIEVVKYNVLASQWLISPTPVHAINMFVHNLQLKTGIVCSRVSIVHHDFSYKAAIGKYNAPAFEKPKGASFIDKLDYPSDGKPLIGPKSLSFQPNFYGDMTISLIIEIDDSDKHTDVEDFLHTAKIAGGDIISHKPIKVCNIADVFNHIKTGFFVEDYSHLIDPSKNQLEQLVTTISNSKDWISAATLGYAKLTQEIHKPGVRNGVKHCFVEPLVGLIKYIPIHNTKDVSDIRFWNYEWNTPSTFICKQEALILNSEEN
jgi:CRISPR type I-F-associated protein Csy2